MAKMKQIACDPDCGFMVRSHKEQEVVEFAKQHAKNVHKENASDKDLRAMMKDV